ncbi:MAG: MmcQ/YjbR family DNA-binding protein [Caulobacterales bacterium]
MSPQAFLELALSLPETAVGRHQSGEDLRVGGKIFASPATRPGGTAVVKLSLEQRELLCAAEPQVFRPVEGMGASRGWTRVQVANVDETTARSALWMAWRNVAPSKVRNAHDPEVAAR